MKINLSECVIAKIDINGERFLAKNRDRKYIADMEIIHEIVDGIEICYLHDKITDWSEGMNELGIGIINSALSVHRDEKEGMPSIDNDKEKSNVKKKPNFTYDGKKIRRALTKRNLYDCIKSLEFYTGNDEKDLGVKGHTIVADPENTYIIELFKKEDKPVIKKKNARYFVRSNHGYYHKNGGYQHGIKRYSSLLRSLIIKKKLKLAQSQEDILDIFAYQFTENNFLNPYRRENKTSMQTTAQLLYNLSNLEFVLKCDINKSKFSGYINKLPKDYKPKIKIKIEFIK